MDKFFSSLDLYDDLHTNGNKPLWYSQIKVKRYEWQFLERNWNSSGWYQEYDEAWPDSHIMERQYVNTLTNMHQAPTEWTSCDEHKYILKPANDRTATAIADGPENEQNSYSYTFLTFQIWTVLSFSLLVVQNHHKNTSDLHWSGAWHNKLKGCPNIWSHNHVRQQHFHEPTKNT